MSTSEAQINTLPENGGTSQAGPLRSIKEIVKDLSRPIPDKYLEIRPQGNIDLTYIPWYRAVQFLDWRAPGWSYSIPRVTQIGDMLVLVAQISIPCIEGVVTRESTGYEMLEMSGWGDPASNAESMALRRAASKFGLGLYLYGGNKKK